MVGYYDDGSDSDKNNGMYQVICGGSGEDYGSFEIEELMVQEMQQTASETE